MNTSRTRFVVAAAALALSTAACSDDDDGGSAATTAAAPATTAAAGTAAPPAGTAAPAAGEVVVAVTESDLGPILVDGDGRTLYLFTPDGQGDPTCVDDCLAAWPALVGTASAGEGADESLLATATRPDDGSEQVTYGGWPLYYFAQDQAAGDVNGQGIGDVWYVLTPEGEAVEATGATATTTG